MYFLIGIDTGVKTGFAVAKDEGKGAELVMIKTLTITQAMEQIKELVTLANNHKIKVFIEDARLRKWFIGGKEKAQGAGSIKRDAQIWQCWCEEQKIPYQLVAPKDNATKYSAKTFAQITGWQGRTSNHGRDAAMLIFRRKLAWEQEV